jgi:hypothetical protein
MDTFAHPDDNPNVASSMDVGGAFLNAKASDLSKYLEIWHCKNKQ